MYSAKIENSSGEILTLTGVEQLFQLTSITGLDPPDARINTTDIAGLDGSKFNSSKLNNRNIVITMKINGDVEANRHSLYRMFRTKEKCIFYFSNDSRGVKIEGYVEKVECPIFVGTEVIQISIICPYPYFRSLYTTIADISNLQSTFYFPFAIDEGDPTPFSVYLVNRETNVKNNSESVIGVLAQIDVLEDIGKIEITDISTNESITLAGTFLEDDRILINTVKGQKSITRIRNGVSTNIFSTLQQGSKFFQLNIGDNYFTYQVDDGAHDDDVEIAFIFADEFRGV